MNEGETSSSPKGVPLMEVPLYPISGGDNDLNEATLNWLK